MGRVAAHELRAQDYPFVVEYYRESDGQLLHTITVQGPGVVYVPPIPGPLMVRTSYASGQVVYATSGRDVFDYWPGDVG